MKNLVLSFRKNLYFISKYGIVGYVKMLFEFFTTILIYKPYYGVISRISKSFGWWQILKFNFDEQEISYDIIIPKYDLEGARDFFFLGRHEYNSQRLIAGFLKNRKYDLLMDIGANVGLYTLLFAKMFPEANILSFEPVSHIFGILEKNIALNKIENVIPIRKAVSIKDGIGKIYLSKENLGHNSLVKDESVQEELEIELISMESIMGQYANDIDLLDRMFLKIDIEGYEVELLSFLKDWIIKIKPDLFIEIHYIYLNQKRISRFIELLDFLESIGYKMSVCRVERVLHSITHKENVRIRDYIQNDMKFMEYWGTDHIVLSTS